MRIRLAVTETGTLVEIEGDHKEEGFDTPEQMIDRFCDLIHYMREKDLVELPLLDGETNGKNT